MRALSLPCAVAGVVLLTVGSAHATEYFVDGGPAGSDANTGTTAAPFKSIGKGLGVAMPGDQVTVRAGTYAARVTTVRNGTAAAPIVLRGAPGATPIVTASGNVLSVDHAFHTFESLVIDGQLGPGRTVTVATGGGGLVARDLEIRNSGRNCIDMDSPDGVLIERARIHHCLFWDTTAMPPGPADAHGITCTGAKNVTVKDSEISVVSGDAIQFSPARVFWDNLLVERTRMWTAPLATAMGMFPAGTAVGENAFDSKTPAGGPRSRATFRDVVAYGWKGYIGNQGIFNAKENVELVIDGATLSTSDVAIRARAPALVTVRNVVAHHNDKTVRYEDGIANLHLFNVTFADATPFQNGGGGGLGGGFVVKNALFAGAGAVPAEAAAGASNKVGAAGLFVNAAQDDYHLVEGAPVRDVGEAIAEVATDRDGVPRPFGAGYDIGAYEWTDQPPPDGGVPSDGGTPNAGSSGTSGTGAASSGAAPGGDDGGGSSGCGCEAAGVRGRNAPSLLFFAALAAATLSRRSGRFSASRRHAPEHGEVGEILGPTGRRF